MIAQASDAGAGRGETIFGVLAERARSHSRRFLAAQAAAALAGALVVLSLPSARPWWPLAALLTAVAAYSGWGLVDTAERVAGRADGPGEVRARVGRVGWRAAKLALAIVATLATLLAAGGAALAAFAGDAPGPYGACTDDAGRTFACDARGRRR
jgi:hypothetical protein